MLARPSIASPCVTSPERGFRAVVCALLLAAATTGAWGADQERPRRVWMVHSFGSSAPPFTTHSTAFESAIKRELGAAVDLDEVSLAMARYSQPDMEEAFAEFLVKNLVVQAEAGASVLLCPIERRVGLYHQCFGLARLV